MLAEGPRVTAEALSSRCEVLWGVMGDGYGDTAAGRQLAASASARGVELEVIPEAAVLEVCVTETPRPVLAVVREPGDGLARGLAAGRYLYLDGVQDPGNVGTLVRSAWAFGLSGVVSGPGSADVWSDKAVRASAGAVFHLPHFTAGAQAEVEVEGGCTFLYAEAGPDPVEELRLPPPNSWVLAVGNEGAGVSPEARSIGRPVSVSMAAGVDSLNVAVAGSILLYVLTRSVEPPTDDPP